MEDLAPSRQGGGSAGQVQLPKEDTAEKPSKSTNTRQRVSVACLPCRKRRMRVCLTSPCCEIILSCDLLAYVSSVMASSLFAARVPVKVWTASISQVNTNAS